MEARWNGFGCALSLFLLSAVVTVAPLGCAKAKVVRPEVPKALAGVVRFTLLAPGAKHVSLVGSFNGWGKDATPMMVMDSSGLWSVDVPLKEGEHTFMYLIDGSRWMTPSLAEDFVTDGFGQVNGVVIVR
jgi:1,4-alpha-glucan branching enzyme